MAGAFDEPEVANWFERRTFGPSELTLAALVDLKRERRLRISVCLPALNEVATIGTICTRIRTALMNEHTLVDELVVVDTGSSDDTIAIAERAGATAYRADDILGDHGRNGGKGAALWKSLHVTTGDVIVWIDSDTKNFNERFVTNLIAPLLMHDDLAFTKAFYDRPLVGPDGEVSIQGARVTEILARPLLHLLYPPLAALVQPLSGEYAGRRESLLDVPFFTGYGVDIGLLIDIVERHGVAALAQVNLGTRVHRNRDIAALGRTAFEVAQALLTRLDDAGRLKLGDELPTKLVQWQSGEGPPEPIAFDLTVHQLPPMREVKSASEEGR